VYRFYDVGGGLIYVGKSVRLRDRVRSYFTGKADCKKIRRLRQEVSAIEWDETGSELEALLLESRLVKRNQPRFNVLLRGFIPSPYVRVDHTDPFPRLEITRAPERDGASYFGPFRRQDSLEAAVGALTDGLLLRDCATPGERLPGSKPCYRQELGTCSAPCTDANPAAYRQAVEAACAALEGSEEGAIGQLRLRMERAAERLQFELAARLRDAARHIQAVAGRQHALRSAVHSLSLVAVCPSRREEHLCLFVFRSGRLVFQDQGSAEEMGHAEARQTWATRLIAAHEAAPAGNLREIDAAQLDEIQIVTAWMKQRTREGAYWEWATGLQPAEAARELDQWLAKLAAPPEQDRLAA
jgi:excinuclease UvrABC nuclease subunit